MAQLDWGNQISAIYLLKSGAYWGVNESPLQSAVYPGEPYSCLINDTNHPSNVGNIGGEDGVTGLDGFEIRESASNLTEAHGGQHGNFWAGRRPHTLSVETLMPTVTAREAALSRMKRTATQFQDGRLFWFPGDPAIVATTRENKILDPSFEHDTANVAPSTAYWTNLDAANWSSITFAAGVSNPVSGTASLRIKGTKDATATGRNIGAVSNAMPVAEGEVYSAKVGLYIADAIVSGTGFAIQMKFMDANGTVISTPTNTPLAVGATGAQTLTHNTITVPPGAVQCQLLIYGTSTTASDTVDAYLDAAQFVQEATAGAYFDGDSANCSWLGVWGGSPSVNRPYGKMITTRLQQPIRINGKGWLKTSFLPFVAADPFIYSSTQRTVGAVHDTPVAQVENQGNRASTPDLIQLVGPAVNPSIQVVQGGVTRKVAFTGLTLAGGDVLSILPKTRQCLKNGANVYGNVDFANTTWWDLMPGLGNSVTYSMSSGSTGASVFTMWYRDCWL